MHAATAGHFGSYDARATFFMLGSFAEREPELVRRILGAGHLIGNHSWSHPNLALTAAREVDEQLAPDSAIRLEQITGSRFSYFRPPFGGRRPFVLRTARSLGMTPVTWNAMTNDWEETAADAIAGRLTAVIDRLQSADGSAANIVLHDGGTGCWGLTGILQCAAAQLLGRYSRRTGLSGWMRGAASTA